MSRFQTHMPMSRSPSPADRSSNIRQLRRSILKIMALGSLAPLVLRPSRRALQGSFLQLWLSHLTLSKEEWRRRLELTRSLGCVELIVQWTGITGTASAWQASNHFLHQLFDEAEQLGMTIRMGLPYDERWWRMLSGEDAPLESYLRHTRAQARSFLEAAAWQNRNGFRGWYIPYEIEQYHWASVDRQHILIAWLSDLARDMALHADNRPAISTYFSQLPSQGTLEGLWRHVLDAVPLHLMIQDGVGVAGLSNIQKITPLIRYLQHHSIEFDLILELFREQPSEKNDGTTFKATSASLEQVRYQLDAANRLGVKRLVGFAVDPWVIDNSQEAKALLAAWHRL